MYPAPDCWSDLAFGSAGPIKVRLRFPMFAHSFIRQLVGGLLCGMAALSLTSMVLPAGLALADVTDMFWARLTLSGYAAHTVLAWAMGGWWTARRPGLRAGGTIMGFLGLGSGLILGALGFGAQPQVLVLAGSSAGFYGLTVGLLIGHLLQPPGRTPIED